MSTKHPTVVYAEIDGFPGYRAGTDGRIQTCKNGRYGFRDEWRNMSHSVPASSGYQQITLCANKKESQKLVHRIIAEAFIGPCPDGMEVCHENGVRTDCRLANLRYDTRANNISDRIRHGTNLTGEKNASAKLTEEKVRMIRSDYAARKCTHRELASKFGVSEVAVSYVLARKTWKHV